MQPVILLDRLSADEMKKHSVHRRSPVAAKAAAAAAAPTVDNAASVRPAKMPRQQKSPGKVSIITTRSTRSKAAQVSMESPRSLHNKSI